MNSETPTRCAGLFVPLFALRSEADLGIGDTAVLREMIDWCAEHQFRVLQILPINETSGDNSPYNAISALAIEPTTLSITLGEVPGLSAADLAEVAPADLRRDLGRGPVRYKQVRAIKMELLYRAYVRLADGDGGETEWEEFNRFCREEEGWLEPYSWFRTLMEAHGDSPVWELWPEDHRTVEHFRKWLRAQKVQIQVPFEKRAAAYRFVQWVAHRQWTAVAEHARSRGVRLMGDIPFGVSRYSADVWAGQQQFKLGWGGGAPAEPAFKDDAFTRDWGQNWGIPLYRWNIMEEDGYQWWQRRVRHVCRYFDAFRIDHVLGFFRIYAFPWKPEENRYVEGMSREAVKERWGHLPRFFPAEDDMEEGRELNRRQGMALLPVIQEAAGEAVVVGEDLGMVPPYVRPSLQELGISGFKVPVFERDEASREYLRPEDYPVLSVATLSTHDHPTLRGFWDHWWRLHDLGARTAEGTAERREGEVASWELYRTLRFAALDDRTVARDFNPVVRDACIRRLMRAKSWLAVLMITDLFGMDIRFNVPGPVSESNWSERLPFTVAEIMADPARAAAVRSCQTVMRASDRAG